MAKPGLQVGASLRCNAAGGLGMLVDRPQSLPPVARRAPADSFELRARGRSLY
jgi:hypothetical protein